MASPEELIASIISGVNGLREIELSEESPKALAEIDDKVHDVVEGEDQQRMGDGLDSIRELLP